MRWCNSLCHTLIGDEYRRTHRAYVSASNTNKARTQNVVKSPIVVSAASVNHKARRTPSMQMRRAKQRKLRRQHLLRLFHMKKDVQPTTTPTPMAPIRQPETPFETRPLPGRLIEVYWLISIYCSGSSQGSKESIFIRLTNRLKAVELNMSLSTSYLSGLSMVPLLYERVCVSRALLQVPHAHVGDWDAVRTDCQHAQRDQREGW